MTTLADDLVPDQLWALVAPCWRIRCLHLKVLDQLGAAGRLDWSRASVDTMSVRQASGIMWAQIPSIVANPDPSCTWSATAAGCR
jgi:hypothetical protein